MISKIVILCYNSNLTKNFILIFFLFYSFENKLFKLNYKKDTSTKIFVWIVFRHIAQVLFCTRGCGVLTADQKRRKKSGKVGPTLHFSRASRRHCAFYTSSSVSPLILIACKQIHLSLIIIQYT